MSIAAGILLQAVASTGSVEVGAVEEPPAEITTTDDAGADEEAPSVDVGNEDAPPPDSRPSSPPPEEEEEDDANAFDRIRLTARGGGAQPGGEWQLAFHGYFRAPMRIGLGDRSDTRAAGQSKYTFHNPLIPDDQYFSPNYTLHNPRDWAELYLQYGNGVVTGNISFQGFNFTDAGWNQLEAQFGVAQAWVLLTPSFRNKAVNLTWKLGSFDNRYGEAGRYDAGEFETYLFGRTHGTGTAGRLEFLIGKGHRIGIEGGIQVKRPNPSVLNAARFTLLHHYHADYTWAKAFEVSGHFLMSSAREADRRATVMTPYEGAPDGKMWVAGADIRLDCRRCRPGYDRIPYIYAGFSVVKADNAQVIGPAIEVIHSAGGGRTDISDTAFNPYLGTRSGQFAFGIVDNYLQGPAYNNPTGTGSVSTVLSQFEYTVKQAMKGRKWDGHDWDVGIKLYDMFQVISSDDPAVDGNRRHKYGVNLWGYANKWFGLGLRYTRVQPSSAIPTQSFSVISPRLMFKTNWLSRESIEVSYSRYIYNQRICPGGNNPAAALAPAAEQTDPNSDNYNPFNEAESINPDGSVNPAPLQCVQPPPGQGLFPGQPDTFGAPALGGTAMDRGQPLSPPDENVFMIKATFWW